MNMKIIPVTTDYERGDRNMAKEQKNVVKLQPKKKVAKVMPKKKVKKIKKK